VVINLKNKIVSYQGCLFSFEGCRIEYRYDINYVFSRVLLRDLFIPGRVVETDNIRELQVVSPIEYMKRGKA